MISIAIDHGYSTASAVASKGAFEPQKRANNGILKHALNTGSTKKKNTQPMKSSHNPTLQANVAATRSYDDICERYSQKLLSHLHLKPDTQNMKLTEIKNALQYAKKYHKGQERESGEPYFMHPVEVAILVSDHVVRDKDAIIAAILHDVVEDTPSFIDDISLVFGTQIGEMINAVSSITHDKAKLTDFISAAKSEHAKSDVVLTIKLCDRLHNMRTIEHMPLHKQKKKAEDTLNRFVPIAKYLNLPEIEEELRSISLRILNQ